MRLRSLCILVVMKMKRIKPLGKVSLKVKVLRLLGMNKDFETPTCDREEMVDVATLTNNYHHDYQKQIESALLYAERIKAKALMEWQKHPNLY